MRGARPGRSSAASRVRSGATTRRPPPASSASWNRRSAMPSSRSASSAAMTAAGFTPEQVKLRRFLDLKYAGQQWSIPVAIAPRFDPRCIRADFEASYRRLYGHSQPDGIIEVRSLRLAATGVLQVQDLVPE